MSNMNQKCFTVSNIRTEIRGGGVILPVIQCRRRHLHPRRNNVVCNEGRK